MSTTRSHPDMNHDFYNEMTYLPEREILSDNGVVCYRESIWSSEQASRYVQHLRNHIPWYHQLYYGKPALRATAWFADAGVTYRYTGQEVVGNGWDTVISEIRDTVEAITQVKYNSVLLHRYPDGKSQMGWHSDDEPELGLNPVIASVSFGESRLFKLRHKLTNETRDYLLKHNSLLVMAGTLQHHWQHTVPSRSGVKNERFNLTFRFTTPR